MNISPETILGIILTFITTMVLFGITIFAHELGHYLAALHKGLVIERFAIGFGPRIIGFKRDGVDWVINWLPLGGFVQLPQMAAMDMVEGESGTKPEALPPISPWAKIVTAFAGPLFSFFLALIMALLSWAIGVPENQAILTTTIGYVEPASPAHHAGLLPGDRILEINGKKVNRWLGRAYSVREAIALSIGKTIRLKVERNGNELEFDILPGKDPELENIRALGFEDYYKQDMIVTSLNKDWPAEEAGVQIGDQVLALNGQTIYNFAQFTDLIQKSGNNIQLEIQRSGQTIHLTLEPRKLVDEDRKMVGIGFGLGDVTLVHIDPLTQITNASTLIFRTLHALGVGTINKAESGVGFQHLSGPLGIIDKIMTLLSTDPRLVLYFMVILNVNLAIMNLLPIPILDGGHITYSIIEAFRKKPMEPKIIYGLQMTFFILLIGLFLYITYFDINRVAKRIRNEAEYKNKPARELILEPKKPEPVDDTPTVP